MSINTYYLFSTVLDIHSYTYQIFPSLPFPVTVVKWTTSYSQLIEQLRSDLLFVTQFSRLYTEQQKSFQSYMFTVCHPLLHTTCSLNWVLFLSFYPTSGWFKWEAGIISYPEIWFESHQSSRQEKPASHCQPHSKGDRFHLPSSHIMSHSSLPEFPKPATEGEKKLPDSLRHAPKESPDTVRRSN